MTGARSYRIAEILGRGAFGAVYLADTVGTGICRRVAIKVLRPEQAAIPGLIERLRDAARMLSMIRHRAIVRVDDLVEMDGDWSVVMEYVEGCDIEALVAEGPFPPRVALEIAEEIASALHVAATQEGPDGHPIRLVHRDVRPGNIRVTPQGEVKLLYLGVARAEFPARETSPTNGVYGTPTYMAPERLRGDDTHAGDVYGLGVTLFEMLAGEPPGQGPMDLERMPPGIKLAGVWRGLRETSLPLRDLICAMLAHSPDERPPARECARSLSRIRGQLGGMTLEDWAERVVPAAARARKAGPDGRIGSLMLERPSSATLAMQRPPTARPGWAIAAGTVVIAAGGLFPLVLAVGAWWVWGRQTSAVAVVDLALEVPVVEVPVVEVQVVAAPVVAAPAAVAPTVVPARGARATAEAPTATPAAPRSSPPARTVRQTGIVSKDGQATGLILTGRAGVFGAGEVPVGTYNAEATLPNGDTFVIRDVTVNPERVTRIECDATSCREIEEW